VKCSTELQCKTRQCVSDSQHQAFYCSRPCAQSSECAAGMECPPGGGSCRFIQLVSADPGMTCTFGQTFCTQNTSCTGPNGAPSTCTKVCVLNSDCPDRQTCESGQNSLKYCRAPALPIVVLGRARAEGEAAAGCTAAGGGLSMLGLVAMALSMAARRRAR
jgi:hypothetical protein